MFRSGLTAMKKGFNRARGSAGAAISRSNELIQRLIPQVWRSIYSVLDHVSFKESRYRFSAAIAAMVIFVGASTFIPSIFQDRIEAYFSANNRIADLRVLFASLGASLIGAATIAFSLVMFAMQVNVERLPYGLFRKFSSDSKLLGAFAAIFILGISIAMLSLIPDVFWVTFTVIFSLWAILLILLLFLYAYIRALRLISPTEQLSILVAATLRDFQRWAKRAQRLAVVDSSTSSTVESEHQLRSTHDLPRAAYFQLNPQWTAIGKKAILYSISYARRSAEKGDHEVSQVALKAIVSINNAYVQSKGKTFFASSFVLDNPLSSDDFINYTLEHLRQSIGIAISQRDEEHLEQTLRTMASLCQIYLTIDYSALYASKEHAFLASGYLSDGIKSVLPHKMIDVVMEGLRMLGQVGQMMVHYGQTDLVTKITENIGLISCLGSADQDYRPVSQIGMAQMTKFTIELILRGSEDISNAVEQIREDVKLVAKMFLAVPDGHIPSVHSTNLAPYFSMTSIEGLIIQLTSLGNELLRMPSESQLAQSIVERINQWADGLYADQKELLLLAVERKSHFTFDLLHWIVHITKLLLAVSNAPACREQTQNELRRSASWLIAVFSWIPATEEAVKFLEKFEITENVFDVAVEAKKRAAGQVEDEIGGFLLSWAFKAGKYGAEFLVDALCGLAVLEVIRNRDGSQLLADISKSVETKPLGATILHSAAESVFELEKSYQFDSYTLSKIRHAMISVDAAKLRPLLKDIASRLITRK